MYGDIIESYREHITLTAELGDFATNEMLREQLVNLEEHTHVIDHYLEDDTLVLAEATPLIPVLWPREHYCAFLGLVETLRH